MRALLLVAVLGGTARADAPADCRAVNDSATTTTDLGCFEGIEHEDDYLYGARVCLLRTDTDLCAGVVGLFLGPPRFDAQRLDRVSCDGNGNSVTFRGVWRACDMAGNCQSLPLAFTGVLAGDHLRGTFTEVDQKKKVNWKRSPTKQNTRALLRSSCKNPRRVNRRRRDDEIPPEPVSPFD